MNIFFLDRDPKICAQMHCDKHVVKMIIEYAQLLSTAHRILDGDSYLDSSSGRKIQRWKLNDPRENVLYKASHINHPSAVWTRQSKENYSWLVDMWRHLLNEYTYRYDKKHKTEELLFALSRTPKNILDISWIDPPPAMPEYCKIKDDSIISYRNYYIQEKKSFAKWTKRNIPEWYLKGVAYILALESISSN